MSLTSATISVVIPTYQAALTLRPAIISIAQQTLRPLEVIVVDDASRDGTIDVVHSLQETYSTGWLKLIRLAKNVGAASARNAGWDAATGTHIAFLDADDLWHPRKLELQWGHFCTQANLVLCGHLFRFPWEPESEINGTLQVQPLTRRQVLWHNPFVTPSVMVLRDIPLRFRTGKRHMEDHLLWQEIVFSGYPACKLNAHLATINKPQFGASGLSSQLWAMQMGELDNYRQLRNSGHINTATAFLFSLYSLAKFARRLAIVAVRRVVAFAKRPQQG